MKKSHFRIRNAQVLGVALATVISGSALATAASTTPASSAKNNKVLLEMLLKNGVINKNQFHELEKAGGDFSSDALLSVLVQNGAVTKDQASTLAKGQAVPGAPAVAAAGAAPAKDAPKQDSFVHMNEKGLEFGSNDGNFKMKIGGRTQIDSQINWNPQGVPADTQLANGVGIRRARLYTEGVFWHDYEFRFEYDFTRNNGAAQGVTDAYLKYIRFAPFSIIIGQQNEGKSMESVMSNNYLTFIERGLPNNAYLEASSNSKYQLGITAQMFDKAWGIPYIFNGGITTMSIASPGFSNSAYTGTNTSNSAATTAVCASYSNENGTSSSGNCTGVNQNAFSGNMSYQLVGRGVILPYKDDEGNLLHLGAWGSGRTLTNTFNADGSLRNGGWQFASAPDTSVDRSNFVNTLNLTGGRVTGAGTSANPYKYQYVAQHVNMFGAELAGAWGPFHTSHEFMWANTLGTGYTGNNATQGFQSAVGWFITGETRPYDDKKGTWNRVIPKSNFTSGSGGWGAWELAFRYDYINLNSQSRNIMGGNMDIGTLALNWYLTPRVRLMTNWMHVFAVNNSAASGNGAGACTATAAGGTGPGGTPTNCYNGVTPNVWETAVRFDF